MTASIDAAEFETLKAGLGGGLIAPGDDAYDDARALWNGMIDKRPALVARCRGVADVIDAIHFARRHELPVSVRGGGHNAAGTALRNDGLAIDLSPMKGIRVDPQAMRVHAQGGVLLGELDRETVAMGLVTTLGIATTTGIAGLTLGGGIGYLMGKYGLACDNLVSADVVTADGTFLTASEKEHADLFWALRGGGGNFGVVTSFEYRLHPLEPIYGGIAAYPVAATRELLHFYREFTASAPDSVVAFSGAGLGPPETPLAGQPLGVMIICHCGPEDEGEELLRPVKEFGEPMMDAIGPMPYQALQSMMDSSFAPGRRSYWRSNFMHDLSDEVIDLIVDRCGSGMPGEAGSAVFFEHMVGAVRRVAIEDTAFANRDASYNLTMLPIWDDPADDEDIIAWVREFGEQVAPFATGGGYVNYLAHDEGEERVRATYGPNYERLAEVKTKYDPTNFFSGNQNIKPAP